MLCNSGAARGRVSRRVSRRVVLCNSGAARGRVSRWVVLCNSEAARGRVSRRVSRRVVLCNSGGARGQVTSELGLSNKRSACVRLDCVGMDSISHRIPPLASRPCLDLHPAPVSISVG